MSLKKSSSGLIYLVNIRIYCVKNESKYICLLIQNSVLDLKQELDLDTFIQSLFRAAEICQAF